MTKAREMKSNRKITHYRTKKVQRQPVGDEAQTDTAMKRRYRQHMESKRDKEKIGLLIMTSGRETTKHYKGTRRKWSSNKLREESPRQC